MVGLRRAQNLAKLSIGHTPHQGTSFWGDKSLKALPSRAHARALQEKAHGRRGRCTRLALFMGVQNSVQSSRLEQR